MARDEQGFVAISTLGHDSKQIARNDAQSMSLVLGLSRVLSFRVAQRQVQLLDMHCDATFHFEALSKPWIRGASPGSFALFNLFKLSERPRHSKEMQVLLSAFQGTLVLNTMFTVLFQV